MEREGHGVPPVPVGLEHVLGLAAAHEGYADRLASDRRATLEASGVDLTPRERAMLMVAPPAAIAQMAGAVRERLDGPDRRRFFAQAATALATLGGGAALLPGCRKTDQDERDEEQQRIRTRRLQSQGSQPGPAEPEEVPPATMRPEPAPPADAMDAAVPPPTAAAPDAAAPPEQRPRPVHPATGTGSRPQRHEHSTMGCLSRDFEDL